MLTSTTENISLQLLSESVERGFDVLPNHCFTIHLNQNAIRFQTFILKAAQQSDHIFHRIDELFVGGSLQELTYKKLMEVHNISIVFKPKDFVQQLILLYYLGKLLSPVVKTCAALKCAKHSPSELKIFRTDNYHLMIEYDPSFQPLYITVRAIESPPGKDPHKILFSSIITLRIHSDYGINAWITSTVYHINCTKALQENTDWSGLNVALVTKICAFTKVQFHHINITTEKHFSQVPYPQTSGLWKLKIQVPGVTSHIKLEYTSMFRERFCLTNELNIYRHVFVRKKLYRLYSCCTQKTTVSLLREENELGLQLSENPTLLFRQNSSVQFKFPFVKILYNWTADGMMKQKKTKFVREIQQFHFHQGKYSWIMAAKMCHQQGTSLPHFQDDKSTRSFVSSTMDEFPIPVYTLFVGLLARVSHCPQFRY